MDVLRQYTQLSGISFYSAEIDDKSRIARLFIHPGKLCSCFAEQFQSVSARLSEKETSNFQLHRRHHQHQLHTLQHLLINPTKHLSNILSCNMAEPKHTYKFNVTMTCSGCSGAVGRKLRKLNGITHFPKFIRSLLEVLTMLP